MNSKTVKLLKKFSAYAKEDYRELKRAWLMVPEAERKSLKIYMERYIGAYDANSSRQGSRDSSWRNHVVLDEEMGRERQEVQEDVEENRGTNDGDDRNNPP